MKKNFRFIPSYIIDKIKNIKSDDIIVATTIEFSLSQIKNGILNSIGVRSTNSHLDFAPNFIPSAGNGRYSRINQDGLEIRRTDLPKVFKKIELGKRPIYGDWNKGSFDLVQYREVYQREYYPPKEITLSIEILNEYEKLNEPHFFIKVAADYIVNRNSAKYHDDLLFCINLLQESVGSVDVFPSTAQLNDYLKSIDVSWEIFPPGERDELIDRILSSYTTIPHDVKQRINDKKEFLNSLQPIKYVYGLSGIRRYFGALITEDLVVFENLDYGNAIYIIFESWEQLSKLPRTELMKHPSNKFIRVIHSGDWKVKVQHIVNKSKKKGGTDDTGPRLR